MGDPGNTVSGHASGVDSVMLHLGDGVGGYWGYNAPVDNGRRRPTTWSPTPRG